MANFDDILNDLHQASGLSDAEFEQPITITSRRTFEVPQGYDLTLGYAGDVNSQIVTFQFPRTHEGHDLHSCNFKTVKWKNLKSGTEGVSLLNINTTELESWTAQWEVPPESMTTAGQLEIAISIYDEKNGVVAFSWNTPSFKQFVIGETTTQIANVFQDNGMPAKNEILIVNADSREIEVSLDWNPIICSFGDIGTSQVYFEINQYLRGLNLLDENVRVYVGVAFISDTVEDFRVTNIKPIFLSNTNKESNRVLVTWDVPDVITNNQHGYIGTFAISLKAQIEENGVITKRWSTAQFNKLTIGPSVLLNDVIALVARDEEIVERAVEGVVDEVIDEKIDGVIDEKIDDYIDTTYFVTEDNT